MLLIVVLDAYKTVGAVVVASSVQIIFAVVNGVTVEQLLIIVAQVVSQIVHLNHNVLLLTPVLIANVVVQMVPVELILLIVVLDASQTVGNVGDLLLPVLVVHAVVQMASVVLLLPIVVAVVNQTAIQEVSAQQVLV